MRSIEKITGCVLVILMAGSLSLNAQKGMNSTRQDTMFVRHDSLRMHIHGRSMTGRPNGRMAIGMMNHGMNPRMAQRMRHAGEMQYGFGGGATMYDSPGRRIMESIPGITEKQKEDLAKINATQREEMQKLIAKNREAVKQLRDDHRNKVMNLLTDEQKKWLEENAPVSRNR